MTNFNIDEAKEYMLQWISDFVSKPNPLLNNFPPCPFAKQAVLEKKIAFEVADKDINLYLCEIKLKDNRSNKSLKEIIKISTLRK